MQCIKSSTCPCPCLAVAGEPVKIVNLGGSLSLRGGWRVKSAISFADVTDAATSPAAPALTYAYLCSGWNYPDESYVRQLHKWLELTFVEGCRWVRKVGIG
jgi:hypothetical protein